MPEGLPQRARAVLSCGTVLYFADVACAPSQSEVVPCVRHDYCTVERLDRGCSERGAPRPASRRRAARRTRAELLDHLVRADEFTLHQLRRERFSLRMLVSAQADGLVSIDDRDERVIVRRSTDQNERGGGRSTSEMVGTSARPEERHA